jgi:hypothetical protein
MKALVHQRCLHHPDREAAARCPECQRFYCRECVSEHDDRILCAACLRHLLAPAASRRPAFGGLLRLTLSVCAVAVIWFFFFFIGRGLLAIPSSFHEGTIWKSFVISPD